MSQSVHEAEMPRGLVDAFRRPDEGAARDPGPEFDGDEVHDERVAAREKRLIAAWSVAGAVVGGWGLVWAQPYGLCLAMQLAICAAALGLAVVRRGRWTLISDGRRIAVGRIALWPALALGLRAFWDTRFIDWQAPVVWGLAGTVAVVALIGRRLSLASLVLPAMVCFSAVWGTLVFVNVHFDTAGAQIVPVTVLGKSYADARSTRYELFLSHWGGRGDAAPESVSRSLHERLAGGDTVCVTLHKGRLGWAWYGVDMCG